MSESKKGHEGQAWYEKNKPEPRVMSLPGRSPMVAAVKRGPSSRSDPVKRGFPHVGEEIQVYMGSDRILVLEYRGTDKDKNLSFKWVATVS